MMTLVEKLSTYYATLKSLSKIGQALLDASQLWASKELSDDEYQELTVFLHHQQKAMRDKDTVAARMPGVVEASKAQGFVSYFPKRKPYKRCPDRIASLARREHLASSNPLPARIHRQFRDAGRAVLKIVGDECKRKGQCLMTLGEIAARAGCCLTTARDTIREACLFGHLTIQERKRSRRPNLANIIRIISAEWRDWIKSPRYYFSVLMANLNLAGEASNNLVATDKGISNTNGNPALRDYFVTQKPSG